MNEELAKIVDAGRTLCDYCNTFDCECCKVKSMLEYAFNECEED